MKNKILLPIGFLLFAMLSGCVSSGKGFLEPNPTISRANPYSSFDGNNQVEPVFLDYVNLGVPIGPKVHLQSTPLNIGISASNSCARIVGTNWTRRGDGFNIILDVSEGFTIGYSCDKTISRLQSRIMIPFKLRQGRTYAFQVIVNDKPIGIIETSIRNTGQYGNHGSIPRPRY